jgi:hypothetical protein
MATEISANLVRWITASIYKRFYEARGSLEMYVEGQPARTTQDNADYYELRLDGPNIKEVSNNYFLVYLEVNVLITTKVQSNLLNHDNHIGTIVSAFTAGPLHIYKYGDGDDDDGSFVGCLRLLQDKRNALEVNRFGIIDKSTSLRQATVEGHYEDYLALGDY